MSVVVLALAAASALAALARSLGNHALPFFCALLGASSLALGSPVPGAGRLLLVLAISALAAAVLAVAAHHEQRLARWPPRAAMLAVGLGILATWLLYPSPAAWAPAVGTVCLAAVLSGAPIPQRTLTVAAALAGAALLASGIESWLRMGTYLTPATRAAAATAALAIAALRPTRAALVRELLFAAWCVSALLWSIR